MILKKIILDQKQQEIDRELSKLASNLNYVKKSSIFDFFSTKKTRIENLGCYIYGDVGRGKSMLMKKFYNSVKGNGKAYFHFNNFMKELHLALRDVRKEQQSYNDELIEAAKRVLGPDLKLLCLDEFQINDVADLMLLFRSFEYIFFCNIIVIFTSNSHPSNLYNSSLQRDLFLNFANNIILHNCRLLCLDSDKDYRMNISAIKKKYFIKDKDEKSFQEVFRQVIGKAASSSNILKVWGRELEIKDSYQVKLEDQNLRVTKLTFDQICRENLSANDYSAICKYYDIIFLENLPILKQEDANEAKRFILFIDEIYENKTRLIILAEDSPENIYNSGSNHKAFKRTISRLNEIQSWNLEIS